MSTLAELKALLERHGLRPRRRLGQNFLIDANFAAAVAREIAPDECCVVLEVGPGTGVLTAALLAAHPRARVLAVELDPGLAGVLREALGAEMAAGRLTLLEGDALEGKHGLNPAMVQELARISRDESRPRRILGANLPYNAATPLIANLALGETVDRIVATIQLELAERLVAKPNTPDYGPLSAFLALRGHARMLRKIGPEVFWPRPQVHSAVVEVRLPPLSQTPFSNVTAIQFKSWIQRLFQHRRKRLGGILKGSLPSDDPRASLRAETLSPDRLWELFGYLDKLGTGNILTKDE